MKENTSESSGYRSKADKLLGEFEVFDTINTEVFIAYISSSTAG
jgi:hypothetical protein